MLNNKHPGPRYVWKFLPQGMVNRPTIYQEAVSHAIHGIQGELLGDIEIYHYVDDLMVLMDNSELLNSNLSFVIKVLYAQGLMVASDKIQTVYPFHFLGMEIHLNHLRPIKPLVSLPNALTVVGLHLLGEVNWLRP